MDYGTEIVTTMAWSRSVGSNNPAGFGNAGVAGYMMNTTVSEKLLFPSDSISTAGSPTLSSNQTSVAGASNSGSFGYAMGGSGPTTAVDKFLFSNDSRTTLSTGLSVARGGAGAMSNWNVAAYAAGGGTYTTVDKFAFSNDSRTTLGTGLSKYRDYTNGVSNSGAAGYIGGGFNSGGSNTFEKFVYSTDTRSVLSGTTTEFFWAACSMQDYGVAGYFGAGCSGNYYSGQTTIAKVNFANDSISITPYQYSAPKLFGTGVSDSV